MKRILVIDGNSIINRAFYGVRPLTTKSGKNTNAIFGMINIVKKQLDVIKPDYAAVAFDLKMPTFRHKIYEHYKEGRHPTPPELLSQFPDAKECLSLMGIHVLELPGYEADDIQGTIAKMSHGCQHDTESYVLSGDRDLLQLIDDKVTVLLATNQDTLVMKRDDFFAKYGIEPSEFVDMKALMGDSSDNIPGVMGIGEKTAATLIRNFKSLEGIYENIDDSKISKGVREKLLRDKDNAFLSRTLARIDINAPIDKELSDIEYHGFDVPGLYKKFTELELNSFIQKFGLSASAGENAKSDGTVVTSDFLLINDRLTDKITAGKIAVCADDEFLYISEGANQNFKTSISNSELSELLRNKDAVCYDGKALIHKLNSFGIAFEARMLDLMLYAYLLNPGSGTATISSLASMFLNKSIEEGLPCPEIMLSLEEAMRKKLREDGMEYILDELEIPLVKILAEMEQVGFKINIDGMNEYAEALGELSDDLAARIYMQAGCPFNINSPKQLGEVLFVNMGLPYKKKTKSGFSTDAETLEQLRAYSPIIDDILEYRQVAKLKNTYASALPPLADKNARIHTDFKQALTATGRLSSADPNLQNIPIKTKMGREMRRYFISKDGYVLVDADYSQIELRLLAHIANDYNMSEAFINGEDIHRKTASAVFGIPEEDVTEEMRKKAKAVNFGIVYGISGFSLAKDIGTTAKEATGYIKSYLMNYPSIDRYLEDVVKEAAEKGYTATPMGRRRYIPELTSQNGMLRAFGKRVAMNAPIQGAAADIMKLAMIRAHNSLKKANLDAKIVMQVHDELVIEVREDQKEECMALVKSEMENVLKLSVPLTVDVSWGHNWLEQS